MVKGEGGGQREESVVTNKGGGESRKLTANEGGKRVIRIRQSFKGSSKFYRDKTIILPPPLPAVNNDRPLPYLTSVSNMTKF